MAEGNTATTLKQPIAGAAGRTIVRSLRLALRPAASLLLAADPTGVLLPHQSALDCYLLVTPGQQAALTGFVSFLKRRYETTLALQPAVQRARSLRQKKLETELSSLLASEDCDGKFEAQGISVSLQYFHGLPHNVNKRLGDAAVSPGEHGFWDQLDGARYWAPHWNYRTGNKKENLLVDR